MKKLIFGAVLMSSVVSAQAADFALGTHIGTPGVGVQATVGLIDSINVRGVVNFFSTNFDENQDGVEYDLDLDLQSAGVILDWHPGAGSFRFSAGAFSNGNEITGAGRGQPGTFVEFGDEVFAAEDLGTVNANFDFDSVAPYLGIGWGNAAQNEGWSFSADIGVYLQGEPEVTLSTPDVDPSIVDLVAAELAQAEANLEDEVDNLDFYPYLSIGVAYRF